MDPIELGSRKRTVRRASSERSRPGKVVGRSLEPRSNSRTWHVTVGRTGVTHQRDGVEMRAAPSAGATYPLVVFLASSATGVDELEAGLYRYQPGDHALELERERAVHDDLVRAAMGQEVVREAPATIVLTADYDRTRGQYPEHGDRYVHMEAGHVAENVHLVGESRGIGSCPVGRSWTTTSPTRSTCRRRSNRCTCYRSATVHRTSDTRWLAGNDTVGSQRRL